MCGDESGDETPGLHQTTSCTPLIKRFGSGLTERMCHIQHFALFPLSVDSDSASSLLFAAGNSCLTFFPRL